MRASDEPNVEVLRQKARILESENERLGEKVSELLRENLALKGMSPTAIDLNLPGLVEQAAGKPATTTSPKSERRPRSGDSGREKSKKSGHGPTEQPALEIQDVMFMLDEADKICGLCGKQLEHWEGKDDVVDVVHRIPAKWIIQRCTLEKCRCPDGCSIVTADGPKKADPGRTLLARRRAPIEHREVRLPHPDRTPGAHGVAGRHAHHEPDAVVPARIDLKSLSRILVGTLRPLARV